MQTLSLSHHYLIKIERWFPEDQTASSLWSRYSSILLTLQLYANNAISNMQQIIKFYLTIKLERINKVHATTPKRLAKQKRSHKPQPNIAYSREVSSNSFGLSSLPDTPYLPTHEQTHMIRKPWCSVLLFLIKFSLREKTVINFSTLVLITRT